MKTERNQSIYKVSNKALHMCWYIGGLMTLHCYVFLNFILACLYNKKHVNLLIVVSQWLLRLVAYSDLGNPV